MDGSSDDELATRQLNTELNRPSVNADNGKPSSLKRCLAELNPDDLEDQLRYALYHLDRKQIDLNRPVTCLACMHQGHMASECSEINCSHCEEIGEHPARLCPIVSRCAMCREKGHSSVDCTADLKVRTVPCDICGTLQHNEQQCPQRFFPQAKQDTTTPVPLWISCCICASKSHLVGDCPDADRSAAARWSLKSLDPAQITNLSLETGTRTRERDAESPWHASAWAYKSRVVQACTMLGILDLVLPLTTRTSHSFDLQFNQARIKRRPQVMMGSLPTSATTVSCRSL